MRRLCPRDLEDVTFELGQLPKVMSLLSIRLQPFRTATTFSHQSCVFYRLQVQEEGPEPPLVQSLVLVPFFAALRGSSVSVITASSQSRSSENGGSREPTVCTDPLQEALQ